MQSFNTTFLDIIVCFGADEKELIKCAEIQTDEEGNLSMVSISKVLKHYGYPIDGTMLSYYSTSEDVFVHCGNEPLPESMSMPAKEIVNSRITMKFRWTPSNSLSKQDDNVSTSSKSTTTSGGRRTKERKIGFIIEKVALWRKLYNGVLNDKGETVRYSLEEAAQKVGISKKSLDDYLLQLRFGRKFGFNFNDHKNDKVGILRAFVKKHKAIQKQQKEDAANGNIEKEQIKEQEQEFLQMPDIKDEIQTEDIYFPPKLCSTESCEAADSLLLPASLNYSASTATNNYSLGSFLNGPIPTISH